MDRHLAARERLDLLGQDVAGDHPVPQLGEAGGGHQSHPADPDHTHRLTLLAHPCFLPCLGLAFGTITLAERAMPIIWSLVNVFKRSFATQ